MEIVKSAYAEGGVLLVNLVMFCSLLIWTIRSSEARECKLHDIIGNLNEKLDIIDRVDVKIDALVNEVNTLKK